jgi:phosphotransferase system enzyme I (PtsP)
LEVSKKHKRVTTNKNRLEFLPKAGISRSSRTLESLRLIVQEANGATDLNEVLGIIVRRVCETLEVDVCSVYLADHASQVHVLMATQGLNPNAIGQIQLKFSEGLVGLVAAQSEPVNIQDAPSHPHFKFIPRSGEEPYHAFLGVPLIHRGEQLGVLVVQQVEARRFEESDVAFLVTLAAQVAGVIALVKVSGLIGRFGHTGVMREQYFDGIAGAPGVAMGISVVVYSATDLSSVPDRVPEDRKAEALSFRAAVTDVIQELRTLETDLKSVLGVEDRALFEALAMIAESDVIVEATVARIHAGNWAPGALRETIEEHAGQFSTMEDAYLRERADDIFHIGQRILTKLQQVPTARIDYPKNAILVGDNLSPIDLVQVRADHLVGVVSGRGSAFSHLSMLARALGVPAVVGIADKLPTNHLDNKHLIVDGYRGRLYVEPAKSVRKEFTRLVLEERQLTKELRKFRNQPAVTSDGVRIMLYTNAGLLADLSHSRKVGAEGVGLYRTELPFMIAERFPTEEEQRTLYRRILEVFAPRPVTLRVLDIGGDKVLPYFPLQEDNAALGWRGIRVMLDHPEIFLTQLRAMLRAAEDVENLRILFPMISVVEELEAAVKLLRRAYRELRSEGANVKMPPYGVMIEVPSAVYLADAFARRVDFVSVGTNDLTQYLLAVDRTNAQVAKLLESLHPAVLHAIKHVVEAGQRNRIPVSVCGEAAGDPAVVLLLLGMGVHSLSLSAGDLPRIKWVIRSFSRAHAQQLLDETLRYDKPGPIRELLTQALEHAGLGGLVRPGK